MKLFAFLLLVTFQAHASVTVNQYGAADIVSATSDYSYTCIQTGTSTDYKIVNPAGSVVLTTTTGVLKLAVTASRNGLWSSKPNTDQDIKRSAHEACEGVKDTLVEAVNDQLKYLFEVKTAQAKADHEHCYVTELRVIHDGELVTDYSYTNRLVACP